MNDMNEIGEWERRGIYRDELYLSLWGTYTLARSIFDLNEFSAEEFAAKMPLNNTECDNEKETLKKLSSFNLAQFVRADFPNRYRFHVCCGMFDQSGATLIIDTDITKDQHKDGGDWYEDRAPLDKRVWPLFVDKHPEAEEMRRNGASFKIGKFEAYDQPKTSIYRLADFKTFNEFKTSRLNTLRNEAIKAEKDAKERAEKTSDNRKALDKQLAAIMLAID